MTTSPAPTNMIAHDGPASRPKAGEVDVVRIGDHICPARVVSTEAKTGSMPAVLIYVFEPVPGDWHPDDGPEALQTSRLLLPPVLINKKPWTMRFFRRVARRAFAPGERLERHTFRAYNGVLYDEESTVVDTAVEPVGSRGLQSYRTLDDRLSDALGIPRVTEDRPSPNAPQ